MGHTAWLWADRECAHSLGAAFPGVHGGELFTGESQSLLMNLKHRSRNKNFKCHLGKANK